MRSIAFEIISGHVLQPGAIFTSITPNGNDSFTLRDYANPELVAIGSAVVSGTGIVRIRSPRLHDNIDGIRLFNPAGAFNFKTFNPYLRQKLISGDTFQIDAQGATGVGQIDTHSLLVSYNDPRLGQSNMITLKEVQRYSSGNVISQEFIFATAVNGDYALEGSLLSAFPTNRIKFKSYYALVSFNSNLNNFLVTFRGLDFPFRYGAPANTQSSSGNFSETSFFSGLPTIPVIYGGNFNQTQIDSLNTSAGGTAAISLILVELVPWFNPMNLPPTWE
jgi:hypothetical protein